MSRYNFSPFPSDPTPSRGTGRLTRFAEVGFFPAAGPADSPAAPNNLTDEPVAGVPSSEPVRLVRSGRTARPSLSIVDRLLWLAVAAALAFALCSLSGCASGRYVGPPVTLGGSYTAADGTSYGASIKLDPSFAAQKNNSLP